MHSLKALIGGALEEPILHEVKEVVQGYVHAHHTVHLPAEQQTQVTTLCVPSCFNEQKRQNTMFCFLSKASTSDRAQFISAKN